MLTNEPEVICVNLEFHDITLDEAPHYLEHWNMCAQRTSDYCFPIIWSLGPDYGTKIAYDEENDLYWRRTTFTGCTSARRGSTTSRRSGAGSATTGRRFCERTTETR